MHFSTIEYETAYVWEKGRRATNEDSIALMDLYSGRTHLIFAALADGIGGLSHGEYASSLVIKRLKDSFEDLSRRDLSHTANVRRLFYRSFLRVLYSCHNELIRLSEYKDTALGTTLSLICIADDRGFSINIGDSRLYQISPGHVNLLSRDDTDKRGRLTRCIGRGTYGRKHSSEIRIHSGDTFILCSDGFYRLGESEFTGLSHPLADSLINICSHNLSKGERDNLSAIAIRAHKD
jgi:serine/threonine protein phosphatase PrpC